MKRASEYEAEVEFWKLHARRHESRWRNARVAIRSALTELEADEIAEAEAILSEYLQRSTDRRMKERHLD